MDQHRGAPCGDQSDTAAYLQQRCVRTNKFRQRGMRDIRRKHQRPSPVSNPHRCTDTIVPRVHIGWGQAPMQRRCSCRRLRRAHPGLPACSAPPAAMHAAAPGGADRVRYPPREQFPGLLHRAPGRRARESFRAAPAHIPRSQSREASCPSERRTTAPGREEQTTGRPKWPPEPSSEAIAARQQGRF